MADVKIIARLGHACGLPWARCQATMYDGDVVHRCSGALGHEKHSNSATLWYDSIDHPTYVLPPTLAEWQAECARERPGEPGPVAEWTSEDGRVSWCVEVLRDRVRDREFVYMRVRVGMAEAHHNGRAWAGLYVAGVRRDRRLDPADVIELGRLMQAADGGTDG